MAHSKPDVFANLEITPDKPIPYHTQVYEALERLIVEGSLRIGEQLPGEPKLCIIFNVSRTVIRQALDQLLRDGRIIRVMGKGTFIAGPKIQEALVSSLTGFFEDMVQQGYTPVSKTLKQESVVANAKVAKNLNIVPGTPVIEMTRLRYVNNTPTQLVTTYLLAQACPAVLEADFSHQSLYAFLEHTYNFKIAKGTRIIEAVLATKEEAKLLEITAGSPLILIDSVSCLADGTPLEYYHAVHRSDLVHFRVDLVRVSN